MKQHRFLIRWLWALAIVALVMVAATPAPDPGPPPATAGIEAWTPLRFSAPGNALADLPELMRGNLWGGQAQAEAQVDERARRWRLAGIAGNDKDRTVIVQFADEKTLPLKAGDKLPDGTLIGEIRDNGVCVIIDGKKRLLPMPGQTVPIIW